MAYDLFLRPDAGDGPRDLRLRPDAADAPTGADDPLIGSTLTRALAVLVVLAWSESAPLPQPPPRGVFPEEQAGPPPARPVQAFAAAEGWQVVPRVLAIPPSVDDPPPSRRFVASIDPPGWQPCWLVPIVPQDLAPVDEPPRRNLAGLAAILAAWEPPAPIATRLAEIAPTLETVFVFASRARALVPGAWFEPGHYAAGATQRASQFAAIVYATQTGALRIAVTESGPVLALSLVPLSDAPTGLGGRVTLRTAQALRCVYLVETSNPQASPVRLKTAAGVKALRKFS